MKEILAVGGYVTVNTLTTEFNLPWGIAVDGVGNLFVADTDNNEVKELLAGHNYTVVQTVGSGFISPASIAVDGRGNVFVADLGNKRVVKLDYADPPAASFPTPTPVGSTDTHDGPRTVTIQNFGNAALAFQPFSAANLLDAVLETSESTSCTGLNSLLLAANSSCTVSFEFQPSHVGAVTGHVNIVEISGNTLIATATGTVTIAANQAGNANYSAAPTVQRTITVSFICAGPIVPGGVHHELCSKPL